MIDVELLIYEVRRRPAVWNQKSKEYHNRDHAFQMWKEIGDALGVKSESAKSKWKHLRDNFRTELKKSLRTDEDGEARYRSGWVWFEALYFLKDVVIPQKTRESLGIDLGSDSPSNNSFKEDPGGDFDSMKVKEESADFEEEATTSETLEVPVAPNPSFTGTNRSNRKRTLDMDAELLDLERKKYRLMANQMEREEQDDTYHFLMSLMTPLKSLSLDRQMFVRIKLQEFIFQEIIHAQGQAVNYNDLDSPPHKHSSINSEPNLDAS